MKNTVLTKILQKPSTSTKKQLVPGALCWAKLSRYPWWPALILERNDVRIPPTERRDTQTATAVLFFGTAEFSWIDASRNLSPWQTEKATRSDKDDSVDFELALHEAEVYATDARLPETFRPEVAADGVAAAGPASPTSSAGLATPSHAGAFATATLPPMLSEAESQTLSPAAKRQLSTQRRLGLVAPADSPFVQRTARNEALVAKAQQWHGGDAEMAVG